MRSQSNEDVLSNGLVRLKAQEREVAPKLDIKEWRSYLRECGRDGNPRQRNKQSYCSSIDSIYSLYPSNSFIYSDLISASHHVLRNFKATCYKLLLLLI